MAFKDITKVLYDGKIKLDYKDKAHRYYIRERINFDLPVDDPKAWSKTIPGAVGVTTLLGDTLEKKGLMRYPLTKALMYLFGFYEFTDDNDEKKVGYSEKGAATLFGADGKLIPYSRDEALEHISYGSKADLRWTQKGADIGSIVHDAIEHYIKDQEFDIAEQYMWNIKEAEYETERGRELALEEFTLDVEMATKAFLEFQKWWLTVKPTLFGAEDILYSVEHHIPGTYDADLGIPIEHHPRPELFPGKTHVRCTTDWKTSNAAKSKSAAAPEGVYYSYFIQDALYEIMRREMGYEPADDLLVVSARKDGGFSVVYASELGFTVDRCLEWAIRVIKDYKDMKDMQKALLAHVNPVGVLTEGEF